jgi:tetratricopeptide (TPR) repeat protein
VVSPFSSEGAWPFLLRTAQLAECRAFLTGAATNARIVRLSGPSGTGKTFLVRELMAQIAAADADGLGLYLDVPATDLEASYLLDRFAVLLGQQRNATRDAPSFVPEKVAKAWDPARRRRSADRASYGYLAGRDLVGQVPVAGPFVRAIMPQSVPGAMLPEQDVAPLRFLMKRSRSRPVLLVVDNAQFLPFAVRETLAAELASAGPQLRLLLVERATGRSRIGWAPDIPSAETLDLDLGNVSVQEVAQLAEAVLAGISDAHGLAAMVHRRSEGNLKSVWFQLRLLASRRADQDAQPTSYQDVITSLLPLDQAVLRFVVFTIGGLTVANLAALLAASDLRLTPEAVTSAVADLAVLGLLVVNGASSNRVRVEHELVAQVVTEMTPEEEKLDLRAQAVNALSRVLDTASEDDWEVLSDRLLGIVTHAELRQSPALLSHVVHFIQSQHEQERHRYLASVCRDSVCWDVLDVLPERSVRALLDAVQKSALFNFGLVATSRLRRAGEAQVDLAWLYEAKYLVQLFQYDDALAALGRTTQSRESAAVEFNVTLNLAHDDRAARIALDVYASLPSGRPSEQDLVILRNSAHLFDPAEARDLVGAAVDGFRALGRRFGVATAANNLGIVDLAVGDLDAAEAGFREARLELEALGSEEVYQPLNNLSAAALLRGNLGDARTLLAEARQAAPISLMQDKAMLDVNAVALDVCDQGQTDAQMIDALQAALTRARKTQDLRFVDVVAWFTQTAQDLHTGRQPADTPLRRRIAAMRANGRVPIEIFVPVFLDVGQFLDVPFVLSPHWRY